MNDLRMAYEEDIQRCVSCLNGHGVILYPTDTIWGLGCNALDEVAIDKIIDLKKRDKHKSFVLLMTDVKQLSKYIASPPPDLQDKLASFSSPTTIIYDHAINLPQSVMAPDGSVAVRITSDPFCRSLIKRLKVPLLSTSANLSGEPSPTHFNLIDRGLMAQVDYTVKWNQGVTEAKMPSTILKLNKDGSFTKIR